MELNSVVRTYCYSLTPIFIELTNSFQVSTLSNKHKIRVSHFTFCKPLKTDHHDGTMNAGVNIYEINSVKHIATSSFASIQEPPQSR